MAAALSQMRRRLERLRQHNRAGRPGEARVQAAALLRAAAAAGCPRIAAAAARVAWGAGYVPAAAVEELEAWLDTADTLRRAEPPAAAGA